MKEIVCALYFLIKEIEKTNPLIKIQIVLFCTAIISFILFLIFR